MTAITIEEAQAHLAEVIEKLAPGEELIITRDARPVARLTGLLSEKPRPVFGRGRAKLIIRAEDDEHLEDFEEYMP
jgi:prevent-host-death family protein